MERKFDEELKSLKEQLITMSGIVESMIQAAIRSLLDRDEKKAQSVIERDDEVDGLHTDIDQRCLSLLALYQPAATDLRFITTSMKINSELERIADQSVNIAQRSISLLKQPLLKPLIDIPRMAQIAQEMVKESLDAFVEQNVELAKKVRNRDDEVDNIKDQVFRELLVFMMSDPTTITRAVELILLSRHIERIADHATNIAEDVVYIVLGKDIRHHGNELGDE